MENETIGCPDMEMYSIIWKLGNMEIWKNVEIRTGTIPGSPQVKPYWDHSQVTPMWIRKFNGHPKNQRGHPKNKIIYPKNHNILSKN